MKNLEIYVLTFLINSIYAFITFFGLPIADWILGLTFINNNIISFGILIGFIVINLFCFKNCKKNKVGGFFIYLINVIIAIIGITICFLIILIYLLFTNPTLIN